MPALNELPSGPTWHSGQVIEPVQRFVYTRPPLGFGNLFVFGPSESLGEDVTATRIQLPKIGLNALGKEDPEQ